MKVLALISSLLVISGCASTPQSKQIQTHGPGSLPAAIELTETPFYPQTQHQCGPAALATVLQAQGVPTTPEELSPQVYLPERKGSLQIEMTAAARRHGMLPYLLQPQLIDLLTEVAAGNPVLVLQNLAFGWYPQWHYAVVIGYDIDTNDIILRSGTTRRWLTPFEVFERTWQRADYWALALVPVGEIPVTAKPLEYLKTAYAFEETGNTDLALKAYQAASIRWPEVAATWIMLGNMAFARHDWPLAVKSFGSAAKLEPKAIASWNNLAYALHAYGCGKQAQLSLQCGLKISPTDKNLHDSVQELSKKPVSKQGSNCPLISCTE
jgi:tetratricopeptide (TPR) repeat protein